MSWRGRSPAPASVYTKSCPLSSLRGERGKPRHECTKPGAQTVKFFARNREVVTRLRRVRYGKSRPVREERRVGALRIMRRSGFVVYMTPRVYPRRSPRDSEKVAG